MFQKPGNQVDQAQLTEQRSRYQEYEKIITKIHLDPSSPLSSNTKFLISMATIDIGKFMNMPKPLPEEVNQLLDILVKLIGIIAESSDRQYLLGKGLSISSNPSQQNQWLHPIIFYFIKRCPRLDKKLLISIQNIDENTFEVVKYICRRLLGLQFETLYPEFGQLLLPETTLNQAIDKIKEDSRFTKRYDAILTQRQFDNLLAQLDREFESLVRTLPNDSKIRQQVTAFAEAISTLKSQLGENYRTFYNLTISSGMLDKLYAKLSLQIEQAKKLLTAIKTFQIPKELLMEFIKCQKFEISLWGPKIEIRPCLDKLSGLERSALTEETRENMSQKPIEERRKDETVRVQQGQGLTLKQKDISGPENILWNWYRGEVNKQSGALLSEDEEYQVLTNIYERNKIEIGILAKLKNFFDKLTKQEITPQSQAIIRQIRQKLLKLLLNKVKAKMEFIDENINQLQISIPQLSQYPALAHLSQILIFVHTNSKLWLRYIKEKDVLSLTEEDIYAGKERFDQLEEIIAAFQLSLPVQTLMRQLAEMEKDSHNKIREMGEEKERFAVDSRTKLINITQKVKQGIQYRQGSNKQRIETTKADRLTISGQDLEESIQDVNQAIKVIEQIEAFLQQWEIRSKPFEEWAKAVKLKIKELTDTYQLLPLQQLQPTCENFLNKVCDELKKKEEEIHKAIQALQQRSSPIQKQISHQASDLEKHIYESLKQNGWILNEEVDTEVTRKKQQIEECRVRFDWLIQQQLESINALQTTEDIPEIQKCNESIIKLKTLKELGSMLDISLPLSLNALNYLLNFLNIGIESATMLNNKIVELKQNLAWRRTRLDNISKAKDNIDEVTKNILDRLSELQAKLDMLSNQVDLTYELSQITAIKDVAENCLLRTKAKSANITNAQEELDQIYLECDQHMQVLDRKKQELKLLEALQQELFTKLELRDKIKKLQEGVRALNSEEPWLKTAENNIAKIKEISIQLLQNIVEDGNRILESLRTKIGLQQQFEAIKLQLGAKKSRLQAFSQIPELPKIPNKEQVLQHVQELLTIPVSLISQERIDSAQQILQQFDELEKAMIENLQGLIAKKSEEKMDRELKARQLELEIARFSEEIEKFDLDKNSEQIAIDNVRRFQEQLTLLRQVIQEEHPCKVEFVAKRTDPIWQLVAIVDNNVERKECGESYREWMDRVRRLIEGKMGDLPDTTHEKVITQIQAFALFHQEKVEQQIERMTLEFQSMQEQLESLKENRGTARTEINRLKKEINHLCALKMDNISLATAISKCWNERGRVMVEIVQSPEEQVASIPSSSHQS